MITVSLDIPTSPRTEDIRNSFELFAYFSHRHPEDIEDIMLGIRMTETDGEEATSLDTFLVS